MNMANQYETNNSNRISYIKPPWLETYNEKVTVSMNYRLVKIFEICNVLT